MAVATIGKSGFARILLAVMAGILFCGPSSAQNTGEHAAAFITNRYLKAAEKGDARAQFRLGYLYERGMVGPGKEADRAGNLEKAMEWYGRSAENDYAPAQFRLAVMLQQGKEADQGRAYSLYEKAAAQGLKEAQFNLALMMDQRGQLEEAAKWLLAAAGQDMPQAMRRLGLIHAEGRGVPQDLVEAWLWLVRAVGAGDNDSVVLVSEIDGLLSDDQRAAAKRRLDAERQ